MHDYQHLIERVRERSTSARSSIHGEPHWRAVAQVGLVLADQTVGSDAVVAFLFGLFHDSMRWNDGYDPEHGPRAGVLARELCADVCTPTQLALLCTACEGHDRGMTTTDPAIGVCWDADRLNLWRVGVRPDAALLSTVAARDPDRILWSQQIWTRPASWAELLQALR